MLAAVVLGYVYDTAMDVRAPPNFMNVSEVETTQCLANVADCRSWVPNPTDSMTAGAYFVCILSGLLLSLILFAEHTMTASIVNSSHQKLQKPFGARLDLLALALSTVVCTILRLPWVTAWLVPSLVHVRALSSWLPVVAPGSQWAMLPLQKRLYVGSVREQRVTGFVVSLLVGLSFGFTPMLGGIPLGALMAVLCYAAYLTLARMALVCRVLSVCKARYFDQPEALPRRKMRSTAHDVGKQPVLWLVLVQVLASAALVAMLVTEGAVAFPLAALVALPLLRWAVIKRLLTERQVDLLDRDINKLLYFINAEDQPAPAPTTASTHNGKNAKGDAAAAGHAPIPALTVQKPTSKDLFNMTSTADMLSKPLPKPPVQEWIVMEGVELPQSTQPVELKPEEQEPSPTAAIISV